jgi:cysteine desulfurase
MTGHCRRIYYFDNNATTLIKNKCVIKLINDSLSSANPSNETNFMGKAAAKNITLYRHQIGKLLCVDPDGLIFTSGATEANNFAIQGIVNHYLEHSSKPFTIITSSFEHSSVLKVFNFFMQKRFKNRIHVRFVHPYIDEVNDPEYGCIRPSDVETVIKDSINPILLSIMHANNETGAIQDIQAIGKVASRYNVFFHTDITQSVGKLRLPKLGKYCDMFSFSAHKFHGMKGQGCLYVADTVRKNIDPVFFGGHQEMGYRPGTENMVGIASMALALSIARKKRSAKNARLQEKKKWILEKLHEGIGGTNAMIHEIGAHTTKTLPNTLLLLIEKTNMCNFQICKALSDYCIVVGVGSACNRGMPSHVLKAMGVDPILYNKVIRISMSDYTTWKECQYLVENLTKIIKRSCNSIMT